ncbi:MAG TPA: hypothetical protein VK404_00795, partial [Spirosoma sp.]|nr:hypothetical protein [Spirosoma sp.]
LLTGSVSPQIVVLLTSLSGLMSFFDSHVSAVEITTTIKANRIIDFFMLFKGQTDVRQDAQNSARVGNPKFFVV